MQIQDLSSLLKASKKRKRTNLQCHFGGHINKCNLRRTGAGSSQKLRCSNGRHPDRNKAMIDLLLNLDFHVELRRKVIQILWKISAKS
jgi:hypothetical protein